MKKRALSWSLIVLLTVLFSGVSRAADDAAAAKDLTAVMALLGYPCGKVVKVQKKGDKDHIATCENGNRYRVYLNPEGRVVADKQ